MLDQKYCAEKLTEFKKAADKVGLIFWLVYGTCLGAIREENFILDDNDVDIGIYAKDINLLDKTLDRFSYERKTFRGGVDYRILLRTRIMVQTPIDITPFYLINNKWYYLKDWQESEFRAKEFPKKYFDKLKEIDFIGDRYKVPDDVEDYLTYLYGEWRIKKPAGTNDLRSAVPLSDIKEQL